MHADGKYLFGKLRERFAAAVARNSGEGLLFSGGLDSALVAACAETCTAISVHLASYGEDRWYLSLIHI